MSRDVFLKFSLLWTLFFAVLFLAVPVLAQTPVLDTGIDYAKATGLVDTDIRIIIARIINVALGLLGIVALALVIWGGYEYMTAGGDAEKIEKAKKIIINAGIGLAIILSAYAITQFVISKLTDAIMGQYQEQATDDVPGEPTDCVGGQCYSDTAFYAMVEPQGSVLLKSIVVMFNFKEEPNLPAPVDPSTATLENIKVVKVISGAGTAAESLSPDPYPGSLQIAPNSKGSTVEFHPTGSCAPENVNDNICFEKNTTYKVILSPNIKEAQISGLLAKNIDCANHACAFYFTAGDKYDNTPPQATMVLPGNSANLETNKAATVSATASDDAGLQGAVFHSSKEQVPFFNFSFTAPYPLSVGADQLKYENFIPQLSDKTKKETWQLSVEVKDLAGHSTLAQQSVNVLPGFCFNGQKDADKTDINCGPNCGECANADCNTNADCASGYCDLPAKKCAVKTKITNVDPKDGAIGNYVTIFGENFGAFQSGKSKVIFLGDVNNAVDNKIALIASCFSKTSWQNDYIVVVVPPGAATGPIKVISAVSTGVDDLAHQDSTNDDFGPVFPANQVFVVNSVVKPGLCGTNPEKQSPKMPVLISGTNFGATQGGSQIKFGDFAATFYSLWSDKNMATQVPAGLPPQKLTVKAVVNKQTSNSLPFEVLAAIAAPHIDYLSPETGSKGSYVTIYGSNFGQAVGKVTFTKNGGVAYNAAPLPNECGTGWSDTQIVAKVPLDAALTDGSAVVRVFDNAVNSSDNIKTFAIDAKKSQANLCKIEPDNGPIGQPVTLYGDTLAIPSNGWGNVVFSADKKVSSDVWSEKTNNKISAAVPAGTQSGPVKVELFAPKFALESNQLNFKVQNCEEEIKNNGKKLEDVCGLGQQCCSSGVCIDEKSACVGGVEAKVSVFAWSFSTGKLPVVPEVVVACNKGIVPSPTPSPIWGESDQVCVNAEAKVRFTSLISTASVSGSMIMEACDNEACDSPTTVQGDIYLTLSDQKFFDDYFAKTGDESSLGAIYDTLTFKPAANNGLLSKNQWYRVTLTTDIKSEVLEAPQFSANMLPAPAGTCVDPVGKKASYCFKFKTKNSEDLCQLGSAIVIPDSFNAFEFNKTYKDAYNVSVTAFDNICWSINAASYDWQWNAGAQSGGTSSYAEMTNNKSADLKKGLPLQSLITKDKETPAAGEKIWAKTVSSGKEVKDDAVVYISPKKPKVTDYWPKCETACPNAAIGATFDMDMDVGSFDKAVNLYDCGTEDTYDELKCNKSQGADQVLSAKTSPDNPKQFIFSPAASFSLSPNHWYKIKLISLENFGIKSSGGSKLDADSVSSWHFRVKNDPSVCALDHINIFPATSIVYWIGDSADYLALPFGAPDNCSPSTGQMLVGDKYNWNWTAAEPKVAKIAQNIFNSAQGSYNYLASSTAVGQGDVNDEKQQVTKISTMAEGKTSSPPADFILQCGYSPVDADCPLPNGGVNPDVGIGSNSCCYERPSAILTQPLVTTNVCPNTAVVLNFTQSMATSTFASSTLGAYNIILAEDNGTAACPTNTYQVAQEPARGFWQKIKNWFNVLLGRPVQAQIYCAGNVKYAIAVSGTADGTKASLILDKPLAGNENYKIIVTKDVKNLYGVSVDEQLIFPPFTTKPDICKINNIKVDPVAWLFQNTKDNPESDGIETNDKDKVFSAAAYYKKEGTQVEQEIQSSEQYKWEYNWVSSDTSIVTVNSAVGTEIIASVATSAKNGMVDIGAHAKISFDQVQPSTKDEVFSAKSTVQVFICENPWPDAQFNTAHPEFGLGYVDAEGTDDKVLGGASLQMGNGWNNLKLLYCRDSGKGNDETDDLPELRLPTVLYHQGDNSGIFKEFFFTFNPPAVGTSIKENKNSIGLRVYSNLDHLTLASWYNNQGLKGAYQPVQVGQYKALQEGRTYYIEGVNWSGANFYSNIYVFSFSDNPTAETLNIVNQLLSNFTLNVNVSDKEIVAKMYRDYERLKDLKLISEKLWSYYKEPNKGNGAYPKLTENPQLGTYLPAYTNSKWKSWQGVLGNLVGYTLPVDPLNGFKGCGSEPLAAYDAETCWNATNSTFVCPTGSRVYQYETKGGTEATLKADFEFLPPAYSWYKSLDALKPAGTIGFAIGSATVAQCDGIVKGIGGKCGDGIVGTVTFPNTDGTVGQTPEVCELGQVKDEACDVTVGGIVYPGIIKNKCDVSCLGWQEYNAASKQWVATGTCLPQGKCGDGVKQSGEICDDGKNNGKYGYCEENCLGMSAEYCGDDKVTTGKEVCDASVGNNTWRSWDNEVLGCSMDSFLLYGCVNKGEKYNRIKSESCSWDCQSWNYCGDGFVNKIIKTNIIGVELGPYEQCEKSEGCQVGKCSAGPQKDFYCEEDTDCWTGVNCQITTDCLEFGTDAWGNPGCKKWKKVCSNDNSLTCLTVSDCNVKCVDLKPGKKYCAAPGETKFTQPTVGVNVYKDSTEKWPEAASGNAVDCQWHISGDFDSKQASDDVNCLPLEAPTPAPSPPSCGNGKIEAGEICDDGKNNGTACTPIANAKTCTYCEYGCQQVKTLSFP